MTSTRAAATIVLVAGPVSVCLLGGIIGLEPLIVVFLAAAQFVTGGWLYWLGCHDSM